jgi:hypothetical protein
MLFVSGRNCGNEGVLSSLIKKYLKKKKELLIA